MNSDSCNLTPAVPRDAVYFLSDLHLGASYFSSPVETERRVVRFLKSIAADAAEIYLVGDVLDYWYEYRYVVPRGHTRFFGALAELADSGVKITWMIGNHDIWIFDYLPSELGIEVVDGTLVRDICGRRFFITHGDGVGRASRAFRFLRALFRNRFCQWLFASVHPRWTVPLARSFSNDNRSRHPVPDAYRGRSTEPLIIFADEYLSAHPDINYFIFGHRHALADERLSPTCRAIILGEWIDLCSYARISPGAPLALHRFEE